MNRGVMNVTNITIVVAFLAALGAWLLLPEDRGSQVVPAAVGTTASDTERSSALEQALTSLKGEMATLRQEHDRLTQSLRATEAALNRSASLGAQSSTPSATEEEGADMQAENDKGLLDEEQIAATLYELDLRLGKEPDDPVWGQKTEMDIATLLHPDVMEGSRVLSADCHSTLCRVEIEHTDADAQDLLANRIPREPPFDREMMIRRINDPISPRTLVYLARPGHPLLADTP